MEVVVEEGVVARRLTPWLGRLREVLARVEEGGACRVLQGVTDELSTVVSEAATLYGELLAAGALTDADARRPLENGMRVLYYLEHAARCSTVVTRLLTAGADGDVEVAATDLAAGIAPFARLDLEQDLNGFQQLLLYLLNCLQQRGYRRSGEDCFELIHTPEGHSTHAWRSAGSIKDFVYAMTRKETNFDQWMNLTGGRTSAASAADFLASCKDAQFPTLAKDRHVFSFRNGVYDARQERFFAHDAGGVPAELVACKYFDAPFDDAPVAPDAWDTIATPHFQGILDFQAFPPDVCRWMYALLGRLLYDVNELDRWQVLPYLKGQASSGKSTILLRVCRNFYEREDVGVLSNNIEKKFGLSAFADKYLFVAPEIKSDLQMEQAEFQSLVSGEDMSICVKYKTATSCQWRVPGIMAGNEVPAWCDNSGSIVRRIVLFDFARRVDDGDMDLGRKLEGELPALLRKCNMAYRWAVQVTRNDNVWKHLPRYFHATREDLRENTNVLEHFLGSDALRFGPDEYMPWNRFLEEFQAHSRAHNFRQTQNFTKDYYAAAFFGRGLRRGAKESRLYQGRPTNAMWLLGADLAAADGDMA